MTVLVRPLPSRVAGNRVVPFRQVQYTNKVRPVALKDWKPPVPTPLPPAPFLGLGTLGVLGLQALAWSWGLLNPTRRRSPAPGNTTIPETFLRYQPGVARAYTGINYGKRHPTLGGGYETNTWYTGSTTPGNSGTPYTDREPEFYWRKEEAVNATRKDAQNYPSLRWFDPRDGLTKESWLVASYFTGEQKITIKPSSGDSATWLPLSDGSTTESLNLPELVPDPEPAATPPAPLPLPLPGTVPTPGPSTEPEPEVVPVQPGPTAPPTVRPALPPSPTRPKPGSVTGTENGAIVKPAPTPAPVTNPGTVIPWPGAPPIGGIGQAPAPTLVGIAQEVGKIERKLELMNGGGPPAAPGQPLDLLAIARAIYELLMGTLGAPTYKLDSPCEVDADGKRLPAIEVPVGPSLTAIGSVAQRVDALAELLQVHKDLKQPNCDDGGSGSPFTGEPVTINFVSTVDSPFGTRPLRKRFMYRDQTFADVCVHANHWEGFSWESGPVQVMSQGMPWGKIQVWASTADEGKRVIRHAAAVAGIDLRDKAHSWSVNYSSHPRYGVALTMVPHRPAKGMISVSKRPGPSGPPEYPHT